MRALSIATLFAAASGFIVLWVASWSLDPDTQLRFFQAYWALFFASAGFIDGITQETTRAVAAAAGPDAAGSSGNGATPPHRLGLKRADAWQVGAALALVVAVVALVASMFWMPGTVPPSPELATGLFVFGLVSYVFQAVLSGILSGTRLWDQYAGLVALDSGIRLVLAALAWWLGWGLPAFLLITVIGALSWVVILGLSTHARSRIRAAVDVGRTEFTRRVLSAIVASGASAALITGFPFVLNAAFPADAPATEMSSAPPIAAASLVAAINQAVLLTRAPVLVPLQRFQSALVVRFVDNRHRIYSSLIAPIGAVLSLGAVGFVAAWLVGPWILRALFPPELFVDGLTLGLLTFASAVMGALIITGTAVLASERHGWYVAGWVVASISAFALLFILARAGFGVAEAVILALMVGPLTGALVHIGGLARR
ncbi:hypothetical protein [Corynebacterium aquatimens]|uniref:O-antigen/teichoic acid export membrane protein n=1 Tax=Corynebacterium aquatimens TaxID=1190508 RepID=A0A931GWE7_9CORY|nr:hypothetical protein [Corynebacterium aquatimens]MBG6122491.1 O-antigen/teichoic acid export membrane protein [Corynebacterium aquatimens]WJY64969.1 hypothetical protein CAQUA_01150 [Corynebacterium aquatimens]